MVRTKEQSQNTTRSKERPHMREEQPLQVALAPLTGAIWRRRTAALNLLFLLATVLTSAILAVLFLTLPTVHNNGIVTFHISGERSLRRSHIFRKPPELSSPISPQDIPSVVQTAIGSITTDAPGPVSAATDAIDSVATTVTSAPTNISSSAVEHLPRGISMGTRQICVYSASNRSDCRALSESLPHMLPHDIPAGLRDLVDPLQATQETTSRLVGRTARGAVGAGLAFSLLVALAVLILSWHPLSAYRWQRAVVMGSLSLISLVCFLIPTGIIFTLQMQAQKIAQGKHPLNIGVESGQAGYFSLGAACCLVVAFGCSLGWAVYDGGK